MGDRSLFGQIRRRSVDRVAIAYVAGAWLLIQVLETLFPIFGLAETSIRAVVIILAIGVVPVLALAWVFEWTPEGIRRDYGPVADGAASGHRGFDRAIVIILSVAVGYFAIDKFVLDPARDHAAIEAAEAAATKRALTGSFIEAFGDRSIAVLPFRNMSTDPEQEFFGEGIAEELLNLLARIERLRVISRTSSFQYKNTALKAPEIGAELDVVHILEGSVRKSGNSIRITAQLIDARTDTHLWSETYDRQFEDVFAIQDEISAAIVRQLRLELDTGPPTAEEIDPRAYELYLQVKSGSENWSLEEMVEVRPLLEEIVRMEPDFLPAIYLLARVYERPRHQLPPDENAASRARVVELVDHMVKLAPESSYANNWQAWIAMQWHNDLQTGAYHLEKSMRFLGHQDAPVATGLVWRVLSALGRYDELILLSQYDVSRGPDCAGCILGLGYAYRAAGRYAEAGRVIASLLESYAGDEDTRDSYWILGANWLLAGEYEKALAAFDTVGHDLGRVLTLHSMGRTDEFEAGFARLRSGDEMSEATARVYAWIGDADNAFEWLEKMVAISGEDAAAVVNTEFYEPIKSDPRFQAFLEKYDAVPPPVPDIEFNPPYPPEIQKALAQQRGNNSAEPTSLPPGDTTQSRR